MTYQPEKKTDIRTVKTVESIYNAFLSLLEKKGFQLITVKMICEEARISRSTFYDHFEDKYFLLERLLHDISDDATRGFVYFNGVTPAGTPMLSLRKKYKRLLREVFFNPDNQELYEIYYRVVSSDLRSKICEKQGIEPSRTDAWIAVITEFYTAGILSMNKLWCSDKMQISPEEMNRYIQILLESLHSHGGKLNSLSDSTKL